MSRNSGDRNVLSPNWTHCAAEGQIAEQVYVFLREFGDNRGLIHERFDPEHPHDYSSCVMPPGAGRD